MQAKLELVDLHFDSMLHKWRLTCSVCGPLDTWWKYWTAARAAREHEAIHRDDE